MSFRNLSNHTNYFIHKYVLIVLSYLAGLIGQSARFTWLDRGLASKIKNIIKGSEFDMAIQRISLKYKFIALFVNSSSSSVLLINLTNKRVKKIRFYYLLPKALRAFILEIYVHTEPLSISNETLKYFLANHHKNISNSIIATSFAPLKLFSQRILFLDSSTMSQIIIPFSNLEWWDMDFKTLLREKRKNISFLTSNKSYSYGHLLRNLVSRDFSQFLDIYDGSKMNKNKKLDLRWKSLINYRFNLIIENSYEHCHVSEQIIDSFISFTIPVYWGGGLLSSHETSFYSINKFDLNGIVILSDDTDLCSLFKSLDEHFYLSRIASIQKNRDIALQLLNESGWNGVSCLVDNQIASERFAERLIIGVSRKMSV